MNRGWFASQDPSIWQANFREPLFTYPKNLFAPLRESRRMILDNLPNFTSDTNLIYARIYELFHRFDVACCGKPVVYVPRVAYLSGWYLSIDFLKQSDAEVAKDMCDGEMILDRRLYMNVAKPPLKYTASWDHSGLRVHNRSGRDTGSAVGTNFEEVSSTHFNSTLTSYIY